MPLKTVNTFPPGGFVYTEKSTGFKVQPMMPFISVVNELLNHRIANALPRATKVEVAEDISESNCQRLGYDPQWCISDKKKLSTESNSLSASPFHQRNLAPHAAAERLKSIGIGAQILKDWIGDGLRPVSPELSQSRADICTGRAGGVRCPHNRKGSVIIASIADAIQSQVEKKNEISARVEGEADLQACEICLCHLPLKVHVPMETILQRTPDAMLNKFRELAPANCWMISETNPPQNK